MTNLTPPPAGDNETPDDRAVSTTPEAPNPPAASSADATAAASEPRYDAADPAAAAWHARQDAPPASGSPYAAGPAHPGAGSNTGGSQPPSGGGHVPPPAAAPVPPQSETARIGTRAVAITATAIGAVVLLFAGAGAAYGAVRDSIVAGNVENGTDSGTLTHAADGVAKIDVDHGFGDMRIAFGDVDEVELEWTGTREWRLDSDGGTLEVRRVGDGFGLGDFSWFGDWNQEHRATLTLPESLAGVDLDVDTGAGTVNAEGEFGEVQFDLGAGSFEIEGRATSVDGEVSAGDAIVELADVREFDAQVSAGDLTAELAGEAPDRVGIDVSAGGADITVPDAPYDVRESVSAGSIDTHNMQISNAAPRVIEAGVSAGSIDLRAD